MRINQAKTIAISNFLAHCGINPLIQKNNGKELWYSSPIRCGDTHPSFKVDITKNLRFDFGIAKGGNIIDLVCELKNSSVKQALTILDHSGLKISNDICYQPSLQKSITQTPLLSEKIKSAGEKEKNSSALFELIQACDIQNQQLIDYLYSRKIDITIAKHYLKVIHFKTKHSANFYYALGFASGNGFEVRNKLFKGFVGTKKTPTAINLKNHNTLSIFEGFMDFLAFLSYRNSTFFQNSVIILNSTNLRKQALTLINLYQFSKIYLFLDNDTAGNTTKQFFID